MTRPPVVCLRPVLRDDCDYIWRINNDAEARQQSVQRAPIPLSAHRRWFLARMWAEAPLLWIVCADEVDVGVVRGDVEGTHAAISIALDPAYRGRGVGRAAIAAATKAIFAHTMVHAVTATIRVENVASQRAFVAAGYGPLRPGPSEAVGARPALLAFAYPPPQSAEGADVVFRCDAGPGAGWGHAMRCLALASALRARGLISRFLMQAPDPRAAAQIEGAGHAVQTLPDGDDLASSAAALVASGARALVLDSYRHDAGWLATVCTPSGCARVVIDDLADRVLPCDVVVNANLTAERLDYRAFGARAVLLGPRFALLRPEFTPSRRPARCDDPGLPRVLVSLGGGALGEHALQYATAIAAGPDPRHVTLVVAGDPDLVARAGAFAAADPLKRRALVGTGNMAQVLSETTLAVSAGGHTCFELAASGVPALLVVGALNQRPGARAWCDAGAFGMLGEVGSVTPAEVASRVLKALADARWLAACAARGRELVDGNGADRVAGVIATL